MAYELRAGGSYRMPTHFGEVSGARNIPAHVDVDHARFPILTRFSLHFRTDAALLERQLPRGCRLAGEPIATLYFSTLKQIQWLAGRGYNVLSFSFPATFEGEEIVTGQFKSVLWESLADPVISGREDLGFNKLWAEIPDPTNSGDRYDYQASWEGFRFIDARFEAQQPVTASLPPVPGQAETSGTINYKYIPKTGQRGVAEVSQCTFWPHFEASGFERAYLGSGSFEFHRASWEQLPTLHHVVNALADLPVREIVQSSLVWGRGQGDVGDIRILR